VNLRNTPDRYGAIAQMLHWAIVALVAWQIVLGVTGSDLPLGLQRLITLSRHKSLGMTIFGLMALRLAWRFIDPPPALPAGMQPYERFAARATHGLLYATIMAMAIVGWLSSSASNLTVSWFGHFNFPDLMRADAELAKRAKAVHRLLAWALVSLIVLHVLAALRHHFLLKDSILMRMLPWQSGGRT
jgi:cytochrome b561